MDETKRKHTGRNIAIVVGAVAVVSIGIAAGNGDKPTETAQAPTTSAQLPGAKVAEPVKAPEAPKESIVRYEITGSGGVSVSYMVPGSGSLSQENAAKAPWTKDFPAASSGFQLTSLVAQRKAGDNGEVGCKITVDGQVKAENTSSGPYAMVTCS